MPRPNALMLVPTTLISGAPTLAQRLKTDDFGEQKKEEHQR